MQKSDFIYILLARDNKKALINTKQNKEKTVTAKTTGLVSTRRKGCKKTIEEQ